MTRFVRAGALGGAIGGVALALVLRLLGEPSIRDAIALETSRSGQQAEVFTRAVQEAGGVAGAVLYGIVAGVVLGVVLAAVRHRMSATTDWRRAISLGIASFVTVALIPFLKYPANPPAVGDPSTITRRTTLYVIVLAWSLVATLVTWRAHRWLRSRHTAEHVSASAAVLLYLAMVVIAFVVLPGTPDAVDVPATLLWRFRLASLGGAFAFWLVTGLGIGWLLERGATVSDDARAGKLIDA
ncbi:MAG: CbtA family protein [Actinomycetota bacterium]|nr:CbtA family protein [Actinomycetota bacterium]